MENPRPANDLGIRMPASLPKAPRAFRGVILRSVQDDQQDICRESVEFRVMDLDVTSGWKSDA